jgi:hypothetical protein
LTTANGELGRSIVVTFGHRRVLPRNECPGFALGAEAGLLSWTKKHRKLD